MSSRITFRQLRAFHAIMIEGGFSAAADRLNVTQSAISKQLSALEDELGIVLVKRKNGGVVTPTPEGAEFFKAVESTVHWLEDLPALAENIATDETRRIRIAATPPLVNSAPLMKGVKEFVGRYPRVKIALVSSVRFEIERLVTTRQCQFALAMLPAVSMEIDHIPLVKTRAVAVMSESHPLAGNKEIGPSDIANARLILPSRVPLRDAIDHQLKLVGYTISADLESSSAITCCRMAMYGMGIAICDPFSPTAFSEGPIVVRPWEPAIRLTYGIIKPKGADMDTVSEKLASSLIAAFSEMSWS